MCAFPDVGIFHLFVLWQRKKENKEKERERELFMGYDERGQQRKREKNL